MGDRPTMLTNDEVNVLVTKLTNFRGDLGPREQVAFDYIMASARTTMTGEVQGYDGGGGNAGRRGIEDLRDFGFLYGPLTTQSLPTGTAQPFNLDEHRFGGHQSNR